MTDIPKPNVNKDNGSVRKAKQVTVPGAQKHTVLTHPLAKDIQKTYRRFHINLFCQYFKCLQRTWASVAPLLKLSRAWECRWHASKKINDIQIFFQPGSKAVLLFFSMQLFFFFQIKNESSRNMHFYSKVKPFLLNTPEVLQLKVFAVKARLTNCLSFTKFSSCCIMKCY